MECHPAVSEGSAARVAAGELTVTGTNLTFTASDQKCNVHRQDMLAVRSPTMSAASAQDNCLSHYRDSVDQESTAQDSSKKSCHFLPPPSAQDNPPLPCVARIGQQGALMLTTLRPARIRRCLQAWHR